MRLFMADFGTMLVTRGAGKDAYASIAPNFDRGETVVFDFGGVELVNNSFADEVFGRLAFERGMEALKRETAFLNVSRGDAAIIRAAMDRRASQKELLPA